MTMCKVEFHNIHIFVCQSCAIQLYHCIVLCMYLQQSPRTLPLSADWQVRGKAETQQRGIGFAFYMLAQPF
jgi:hypothetical protein